MRKAFLATIMLALAGGTFTTGCGDDDNDNGGAADGDGDGGDEPGDDEPGDDEPGDDEPGDGTDEPGDGTDEPGDGTDEPGDDDGVDPVADCPEHPNVASEEGYCVIGSGTETVTVTEDLTIAPVKDKQWVLDGKVIIGEDVGGEAEPAAGAKTATLTIEPGTTIYGESAQLSYLVIARGSKIVAEGTKDAPIVFTALSTEKAPGSWGGIALNGRAKATCGIECPAEGESGFFGGPDDADSSGSLKYVRVEWAGYAFSAGNELNGITFNGVGSGTEVDYIQVHYNADDGVEFFGGAVNAKHVFLVGNQDDNIDWQLGWRGKLQYAVVMKGSAGDSAIEADNNSDNADADPISNGRIANLTVIGNNETAQPAVLLRRGTKGQIHSLLLAGSGYTGACLDVNEDTWPRLADGELVIKGSQIGCATNFANDNTDTMFFNVAESGNATATAEDLAAELRDTSLTTPDLRLKEGSELLTGGSKITGDDFFDEVEFVGAFDDTNNWADGWTAFPEPTN